MRTEIVLLARDDEPRYTKPLMQRKELSTKLDGSEKMWIRPGRQVLDFGKTILGQGKM